MSSPPIKVLFVTSSYPRSADDTASVFLRYLAEGLIENGVEIDVLAPAAGRGATVTEGRVTVHRFQYLPAVLQRLAYGSGILPNLKRSPLLWTQVPFFILSMTASLLLLLARWRFDVIHAHWILPAGIVGLIGSRLFRVPLIVTSHGSDAFGLRSRWARALKDLVLRHSAACTANTKSTAAAAAVKGCFPQSRIIPMGVDVGHFASGDPTALRRELSAGDFLVLFVGRLIEHKGCDDLLQAVDRLPPETRARTNLWIIGDGDQKKQLEQLATDIGIREKVQFCGVVEQQQLPDFYAAADLVVVPSRPGASGELEGQSIVVLEAFAARSCVLATRLGGIPSLIQDRVTGVLAEPGNPAELSTLMEELLRQPLLRQRLTENAFATVRKYSWPNIAADFAQLYRAVRR